MFVIDFIRWLLTEKHVCCDSKISNNRSEKDIKPGQICTCDTPTDTSTVFSTFDWGQLAKVRQHGCKDRLIKSAKMPSLKVICC